MSGDGRTDGDRGQLWHGRFESGPAQELVEFTESLSYDHRLIYSDIACSRAHAKGLRDAALLTEDQLGEVLGGLDSVELEYRDGSLEFTDSDEDIHTAIERRVTELVGAAGGRIHTGRSRNDQVATAFRHYLLDAIDQIAQRLLALTDVLAERATEVGPVPQDSSPSAGAAYLPGFTHLQQAQPVLLSHHLMAHCWALLRDLDRLADCRARVDVSPLGAGALAGSSLPLDPDRTAEMAGFSGRFENSLDATSDRDFVAETLFVLTMVGIHLSRMGEEIVLWTSDEFGFATLDDAYSTGSSMLPQKKNPDIAELARGKAGRLIGDLTGLLATLKSLPLAYNRDLQEDKEPIFDALDTVGLALGALTGLYGTLTFDTVAMAVAADSPNAAATDLAEMLVADGVPFREAHATVGALVRQSMADGTPLVELVRAEPHLGEAAAGLFEPGAVVARRTSPGGGGPKPVMVQAQRLSEQIGIEKSRWASFGAADGTTGA